jgi:hypothetical protein
MVEEVIGRLLESGFILVHGSSGCGKSSLVEAGVIAQLQQQRVGGTSHWRAAVMRPGDAPLRNLAAALSATLQLDASRSLDIRRALNRGYDAAPLLSDHIRGESHERVCIVLDQFEELFRFASEVSLDEARLFTDVLVGIAQRQIAGLYVIATMRSEFLGDCARFPGLAETFNATQYLLPRMNRSNLMRAVQEPAWLYGGEVAPELAQKLVEDTSASDDELPLIQHALMLLWRDAQGDGHAPTLTLRHYQSRGGVAALLSNHADAVANAAAERAPNKAIEEIFRALTDINPEGHAIRRPQRFGELVSVSRSDESTVRAIIDEFRGDGVSFLTPYAPNTIDAETIIDVSHEALIRRWGKIADERDGWLQREFQDGLVWRSLLLQAESFKRHSGDVLSAATTEDRENWLTERCPAWSERYGNHWEEVTKLLEASRLHNARRHSFWRYCRASQNRRRPKASGVTAGEQRVDNLEPLPTRA